MRGPEPHRQRQLRPVHHCPGRYRRLATAVEAFVSVRPALQQRGACAATGGADKPLRPTPLQQERRATRLVGKARLKLAQRSRPSHACPLPPDADRRRTAPLYYILTNLGQRDEPLLRANGDAREPALASRHPDLPDNAGSGDDLRRTARMSAKISMTHRWREMD